MLPLIVIGATDRVTEILTPFAEVGHISYHPTAEAAHHALLDGPEDCLEDGRWNVHVAYGPKAYGALCTARTGSAAIAATRLWHTGHTLVLGLDVTDPKLAIRAVGGEPSEEPDNTMIWQAAVAVAADMILDLESTDAVSTLVRYLEWKSAEVSP
jgi:hypothetical protein